MRLPARGHAAGDHACGLLEAATTLQSAFLKPGVVDRTYDGPLGSATGSERLQIRLYDILAHSWDFPRLRVNPPRYLTMWPTVARLLLASGGRQ